MKKGLLTILACVALAALASTAGAQGGADLSWLEWSGAPFAAQENMTPDALAEIEAWISKYTDTNFTALYLAAVEGQDLTGTGIPTMEKLTADRITGPFFEVCITGSDELYRGYSYHTPIDALASGDAYLRRITPDSAIAAVEKSQRMFTARHFERIARKEGPMLFCVLESPDYALLGNYSMPNQMENVTVYEYQYRMHVINADTGALVAWQSYGPPYLSAPDSLTASKDVNGRYVSFLEKDVWEKFLGGLTYTETLTVDGKDLDISMDETVIVLPAGLVEVGENAFAGNTTLESITIPEGVVRIGAKAFSGCTALREVILPDTVVEIGEGAFEKCESLQAIRLPEGLTEISDNLFFLCSSLSEVNMPKGIRSIGRYAFASTSLREILLPEGLEYIGDDAFRRVKGLETAVVPGSVKTVRPEAFSSCPDLVSIVFEEGVELIGWDFCYDCGALKEVSFPSTLRKTSEAPYSEPTRSMPYGVKVVYN